MRHLNKIRETNGGKIKEQDVSLTQDSPQSLKYLENHMLLDISQNLITLSSF